jgi:hypothetical protein
MLLSLSLSLSLSLPLSFAASKRVYERKIFEDSQIRLFERHPLKSLLPRVPNLLQKSFANAFSGKGFCLLFDRLQKVRRGVQGYRKYP